MLHVHQHEARFASKAHARYQVCQFRSAASALVAHQLLVQKHNRLRAEVSVQLWHERSEERAEKRSEQFLEMLIVADHERAASQTVRGGSPQTETSSAAYAYSRTHGLDSCRRISRKIRLLQASEEVKIELD